MWLWGWPRGPVPSSGLTGATSFNRLIVKWMLAAVWLAHFWCILRPMFEAIRSSTKSMLMAHVPHPGCIIHHDLFLKHVFQISVGWCLVPLKWCLLTHFLRPRTSCVVLLSDHQASFQRLLTSQDFGQGSHSTILGNIKNDIWGISQVQGWQLCQSAHVYTYMCIHI